MILAHAHLLTVEEGVGQFSVRVELVGQFYDETQRLEPFEDYAQGRQVKVQGVGGGHGVLGKCLWALVPAVDLDLLPRFSPAFPVPEHCHLPQLVNNPQPPLEIHINHRIHQMPQQITLTFFPHNITVHRLDTPVPFVTSPVIERVPTLRSFS